MSRTQRQSPVWLVVLALLAAATAGGNWFLRFHAPDSAKAQEMTAPTAADADARVVCFGHVDVEFGVRSLYPAQPGRVVEVLVHEGDAVEARQPLLRIDDTHANLLVREAEADLKAAQAQLQQADHSPARHQSQMQQQQAAITATQKRLSAARHVLERKRSLLKIQQLSQEEADAAADLVQEIDAALQADREKLHELSLVDPQIIVQRAREEVAARQARLERARQALDECTLRAPAAGEVLRVLHGPGDLLGSQPKQPAVQFAPRGDRFIRAEVTQEFADCVHVGASATIQDDTQATKTWRGTVQRISDWFTNRRSVMQEPLQVNDVRTVECIIRVEPSQPPLRIGQRVRVYLGGKPSGGHE